MGFPCINCFNEVFVYDSAIISSAHRVVLQMPNFRIFSQNSFINARTRHPLSLVLLSLDFEYFNFNLIFTNYGVSLRKKLPHKTKMDQMTNNLFVIFFY